MTLWHNRALVLKSAKLWYYDYPMTSLLSSVNEIIVYGILFTFLYYQVFFLVSFFEKKNSLNKDNPLPDKLPSVTIIVPCFNEEKTIQRTVESLLALDYPMNLLSIYLIDDGSVDKTPEVMNQYASGYPNIKVWRKKNGGKWRALNYGIERSSSELIGCLDADSFVDTSALKEIVKYFNTHKDVMAVTPSMRIWEPNNLIRMIQNAEYDFGIFMRKVMAFLGAIHVTPGPFSIFKRKVFEKLGPYRHAHNTEDLEMALRMQKAGMKIENANKAIVYTVGPDTPYKLYRQRIRWTGGFLQNLVDYRGMIMSKKHNDLGLFILPMTIITVLATLYFVAGFIWNLIAEIYNTFLKIQSIGLTWPKINLEWSWFYVDTNTVSVLSVALLVSTILCIILGRIISNNKKVISLDIIYFVVLYGLIAPFWLIKSVYNTLASKEAKWR